MPTAWFARLVLTQDRTGLRGTGTSDCRNGTLQALSRYRQQEISRIGVEVTTEDQFLTIYTSGDEHDPTDDSARLYFFLKQVNPPSEKFGKQNGNAGEAADTPVPEAETTTAPTA